MMKMSTTRRKELVALGIGPSTVQGWIKQDEKCPVQGRIILSLLDEGVLMRREIDALKNEFRSLIIRTAELLKS